VHGIPYNRLKTEGGYTRFRGRPHGPSAADRALWEKEYSQQRSVHSVRSASLLQGVGAAGRTANLHRAVSVVNSVEMDPYDVRQRGM